MSEIDAETLALVPPAERTRLVEDRLPQKAAQRFQLEISKAAGDAVDEAEIKKVDAEIAALEALKPEAS